MERHKEIERVYEASERMNEWAIQLRARDITLIIQQIPRIQNVRRRRLRCRRCRRRRHCRWYLNSLNITEIMCAWYTQKVCVKSLLPWSK